MRASIRPAGMIAAAACFTIVAIGAAAAQKAGPFGVAPPEPGGGVATGFFGWIAAQQASFYKALTASVRAIRDDPLALAALLGLSFGYGVFHAAGPGHGKAVISAYVLAGRETARRGAVLSFASALLQAIVAIAVVAVGVVVLSATSLGMTQAAQAFEIAGYALITGLGLWLVWTRAIGPLRGGFAAGKVARADRHAHPNAVGGSGHAHHQLAHDHDHAHESGHGCACGHAHAPDPAALAESRSWRRAAAAVLAVGVRPCTGALIVLVFAFSQSLYLAGIASALAMAAGTGLTVAALVLLSVASRDLAARLVGAESRLGAGIHRTVEVAGAFAVLAFGVILLGGALVGHASAGG